LSKQLINNVVNLASLFFPEWRVLLSEHVQRFIFYLQCRWNER